MNIRTPYYVLQRNYKLIAQAIFLCGTVCMLFLSTVAINAQNDDSKLIEDLKNNFQVMISPLIFQ